MARNGCFRDIRLFVACYGILVLTDIMAGAMKSSSITTIERRFDLPTTVTALIASSFQIGTCAMLPFVSYFGSRWHRPRALFVGSVLLVLGNLIASLPQFIGGRYKYEDVSSNATVSSTQILQCSENASDVAERGVCEEDETQQTNKLYILIVIGTMLNGVGGSAVQPLGVSYIDDNAPERNSPLYLGITKAIGLVGPMAGYILSSMVLRLWVDIGWIDSSTVTISPIHQNWVGAWWLGLIICSFGIALSMMPFLFFPKEMKIEETKEKEKYTGSLSAWDKQKVTEAKKVEGTDYKKKGSIFGRESRNFIVSLKRVLSNVTFLLLVAKFWFASSSIVAIIYFFPKYLEVSFGVSASRANFLTGVTKFPCLVTGILLGGVIMKRMNLTPVGSMKLIAISTVCTTLSFAPLIFVGCDAIDIAGITIPYSGGGAERLPNPNSLCNMDCNCADGTYNPVCGSDGTSYISPCHAGCTDAIFDENGRWERFTDCRCITQEGSGQFNISSAKPERCEFSKCSHLIPLVLAFKAAGSFFGGLGATPLYILLMRSVDKKDKAFAIGLNLLIVRLLGWIPGPLIFGAVIDSTCVYWGNKSCTDQSFCKVYNNKNFRQRFYGLNLVFNILSCVTISMLYVVVKRRKNSNDGGESDRKKKEEQELDAKNGNAVGQNGDENIALPDEDTETVPRERG